MRLLYFLGLITSLYSLPTLAQRNNDLPATMYEEEAIQSQPRYSSVPRHNIAVLGGAVFPQGNYNAAGYALTGVGIDIAASFRVHRNWCAGLWLKGFQNPTESARVANTMLAQLSNTDEILSFSGSNVHDSWQHLLVAVGGGISLVEKKTTIDLRLMGGALYTAAQIHHSEGTYTQMPIADAPVSFSQTNNEALNPAVAAYIALSRTVGKRWGILLKGDYIAAVVRTDNTYHLQTETYSSASYGNTAQSVQIFGIGLGFIYYWGRVE